MSLLGRATASSLAGYRFPSRQYTIRDLTPRWSFVPPGLALLVTTILFVAALGARAAEPPAPRVVAVKVVDRLGRPVKEVSACLLPACSKVALRPEKDGFVAEVPAGGKTVGLRLSARSFEPAEVTVAPEAAAVEAVLKAKGSVRGSFLAIDEKRSGNLTVSLKETVDPHSGTKGSLLVERAVSLEPRPAQNAVVLDDVPPGDWVLWWEGPSLAAGTKVVRVGETRSEVGTVQVVAGRSVEGAVRDDLGMVVPGAQVRLRTGGPLTGRPLGSDRSARSGSDGGFAVSGLPLDEIFTWDVTAPGHEDARGTLGGETRLEVVVTRAQRVTGRLVDEEGLPVAGSAVDVSYVTNKVTKDAEGHESRSTSVEGHRDRVVTGENGTFSFFRYLPASVQVAPEAGEHLPETRTIEALDKAAERGELDLGDLVLRKGRTLTGRVTTRDGGVPVAGARLTAAWRKDEHGPMGTARADTSADGTFRLDGILPGPDVTLTASKDGFAPKTVTVTPEADSVDLLLGRGGQVEGRVCGTAWELAQIAVWYGPGGGFSNQNQIDPDPAGRFVLENAEPGEMTLVRSWRYRDPARSGSTFEWSGAVRAAVDVKAGETSRVSLGCDGILLSGVVTRGGRPVSSAIVRFSIGGMQATDALLDANGVFSTRVPSPGQWLASAGGSRVSAAAACEVPPGGLEGCRIDLAPAPE
jgi:hypothetical protein